MQQKVEEIALRARLKPVRIGLTDFEGHATPGIYFELGALVRHRRDNYRGVIVSCDPCCKAGDTWYYANKTQPSRDQPWYHILVHDSGGLSTYVAQSNLEADATAEPVEHPRIACYFSGFKDGRYILNPKEGGACSI
ncbi:MAG: heat shock protein HspQ [Opitutales bacterium]